MTPDWIRSVPCLVFVMVDGLNLVYPTAPDLLFPYKVLGRTPCVDIVQDNFIVPQRAVNMTILQQEDVKHRQRSDTVCRPTRVPASGTDACIYLPDIAKT